MAFTINTVQKNKTTWDTGIHRFNALSTNGEVQLEGDNGAASPAAIYEPPHGFQSAVSIANMNIPRLKVSKIRDFDHYTTTSNPSQYESFPSTAKPQPNQLLSYRKYGLRSRLVSNFASLGIHEIYSWQAACLSQKDVLSGAQNFVYTASTGAGKSLVADVLMLKRVLDDGKKAILILPFVALVQEKTKFLRQVVDGLDMHVELRIPGAFQNDVHNHKVRVVPFFGGSKARAMLDDADIAVCTIEKANFMINSAIEEGRLGDLGIVVVDELHMVGDLRRGYSLECLVSKIRSLEQEVQIVAMSATVSSIGDVARWLQAKTHMSDYKPVPVTDYLVKGRRIYLIQDLFNNETATDMSPSPDKAIRTIEPSLERELLADKDNVVVSLAMETFNAGYGVLVFCSSRLICEKIARLIARAASLPHELPNVVLEQRREVLDSLRSLVNLEVDPTLEQTIPWGVAFHHAGLTVEEKDVIQESFDKGIIKVLVSTSSLASGVNLPARRVIMQEARQGIDIVSPAVLRQMRGRAGRRGKDKVGESFVCCNSKEMDEIQTLLQAEIPPMTSSLKPDKRGIKNALLEVIAIRLATSESSIDDYVKKTLLYHCIDRTEMANLVTDGISPLISDNLIFRDDYGNFEATSLGKAIVAAGVSPRDGIFIHNEIKEAMQQFVMDSELHFVYMVTPVNMDDSSAINWKCFEDEIETFSGADNRVLRNCGINPKKIAELSSRPFKKTRLPEESEADILVARKYRRFYVALQLRALCNEETISSVAKRFDVARGKVQALFENCHGFAAGMIKFCERMSWGMLGAVLEHMADRLRAGARTELLELARIPFVKSKTARCLWENGYRNLRAVAQADPGAIAQVLLLAQPEKRRVPEEEERCLMKLKARAEIIVQKAERIWDNDVTVEIEREM